MRKILITFICLIVSLNIYSQNKLPNSIINLEAGMGVSHGGLGLKSVIGWKNSGLFIGVGSFVGMGEIALAIGGQISHGPLYVNLGYGTFAMSKLNDKIYSKTKGMFAIMGGMVPLEKRKIIFLDFGLGLSIGAKEKSAYYEVSRNGAVYSIGLGFRISSS